MPAGQSNRLINDVRKNNVDDTDGAVGKIAFDPAPAAHSRKIYFGHVVERQLAAEMQRIILEPGELARWLPRNYGVTDIQQRLSLFDKFVD